MDRMGEFISISILIMVLISLTPVSAIDPPPSDLNIGPYVDELEFRIIENPDERVIAIDSGTIEMDTGFLDPRYIDSFGIIPPEIDIFSALRNGYGLIYINCMEYPLNITGLRRAFAYAFDKTAVTLEVFEGFSYEHDSVVPFTNGWCAEDEFDWHYYTAQPDIGNQILDDLGFTINATSGYRLAPNGETFHINIRVGSSDISTMIGQIGVEALHSLNIEASSGTPWWYDPDPFDEYNMVFSARDFGDFDVDWLAYDFWSEYAGSADSYLNPSNFANATYDLWRNQLLHSTTYEEVYEAAVEMQKILHYNVPALVIYENSYMQAYRNDRFTGHIEDLGRYITGPWTMRKIHKLDHTFGGTVPIALEEDPDSFNIFVASNPSAETIISLLYSSLYKYGPDLNPWPDLATNLITETNSDNTAVPLGHTRFTIDILHNATWSDGEPLTTEDIAYTFTYLYESALYGNPVGEFIEGLIGVYAPNPYRIVFEFNTESYWHFSNFAFTPIIPEHIFNGEPGIRPEDWDVWNPVFNSSEPHVTCGPFLCSEFESGAYYKLVANPSYHYRVLNRPSLLSPTISSVPDIVYVYGTLGNEITWTVTDEDPVSYEITMNETIRSRGNITSDTITHNIDYLLPGHYAFTISVTDSIGNLGTSTTQVYVLASPFHGTDGSINTSSILAVSISGGSVVIILYAIVSIYRNERFDPYLKIRDSLYNSKIYHKDNLLLNWVNENRKETA